MNRVDNMTQLCFRMLLHIYDNKVAYNQDTPLFSKGGLYHKMEKHPVVFRNALSVLKDKALVKEYEDDNRGLLYASITPKGIQMVEGEAKVMMAYFT
jgi:hypothetical protein